MTNLKLLALTLTVSGTMAGAALAEASHGHGGKSGANTSGMMQQNADSQMLGRGMMPDMKRMHDMMMQMHGRHAMGSAMMDRQMLGMGKPGMLAEKLQSALKEYDTDSNGTLSIDEFETFHSAMIREQMVDRFQHLDADGNGAVTEEEISTQTARMKQKMEGSGMGNGGQPTKSNQPGDGMMDQPQDN
ncbi:EF-hand domain-containing protein [Leisingera aquimarina]|uniref:EF-hand domain-containing protein n=1 Tax=Leisingera aquimarina TaxID=476529 RepID=UPI0003F89E3E|nr:EF-hand domain-containing protein [Leisingera aquimarina]